MKNTAFHTLFLALIFIYSCTQSEKKAETTGKTSAQCYTSVSGRDSANLVLKEAGGRMEGNVNFYFAEKDNLTGNIAGIFKGDTLYADYTFQKGSNQEVFRNPLVFLRKDGKLYQGYGEVISTFGRTHFKDGAPIDFTKGFVFNPGNCQ